MRSLWPTPEEHSPLPKETIGSWRKRPWSWFLGLKSSTHTCLGISSPLTLTISRYRAFAMRVSLYQLWHLAGFNGGYLHWLYMSNPLNLRKVHLVQMLMLRTVGKLCHYSYGRMLEELHDSHQGMSRRKERARMVVWWPSLDKDIEAMASCCITC